MAAVWRSKWLDWQPGDENISVSPETELTKLTKINSVNSVSANLGKDEIISDPKHDPTAWRDDFLRWMREHCMHREGCQDWGGICALHRDFVEWSISVGELPATQEVFITLLTADGWQIQNNMIAGLFLREDMWALKEH